MLPRPELCTAIKWSFPKRIATIAALFLAGALALMPAHIVRAAVVYRNDFQAAAGPEWSNGTITSTPAPADGSRRFLGRLDNGTVTLSLVNLAPHTQATLECDLYVIGTWDGIDSSPYGPDRWTLGVAGGPQLLDTSFSNVTSPPFGIPFAQNYPDAFQTIAHGQFTGAVEARTLGYVFSGYDVSAVYHLSYSFPDTGSMLAFNFTAAMGYEYGGPHDINEESWGLDSVRVTTDAVADVAEGPGSTPLAFAASPNPCTTSCTIQLVPRASEAVTSVSILDLAGRVVRRLSPARQGADALRVSFPGLNPGIYFACMESAAGRALGASRIVVVR